LLLAVFLGFTGTSSAAEFEWGIVFRDRRPVVLESSKDAQSHTVVLCNSSGRVASGLVWSLEGFHFTDGEKAVDEGAVASLSGGPTNVAPGACGSATVTVAPGPEIDAGPFVGRLVVTSVGGGVARLGVSVAGPASPIVPTKGAAETIELTATRKSPFASGPVSINGESALALKAPPPGKSLELEEEKGAFIGNLVNAGDIASVHVTGKVKKDEDDGVWLLPIKISGASHTGVYEGVLTPTTSGSETQTVKVKVSVTVWWIWAVLAVLLGSVLAVLPTLFFRRTRVKCVLRSRRNALVEAYAAAGTAFHKNFPKFAGIEAPPQPAVEAYASAVKEAVKDYSKSTWYFDTTSDAYAKLVKSLDTADADIECLAGEGEAGGLGDALTELQGTLEGLATQLHDHLPIDRQPTIALAAAAVLRSGSLAVGEATIRAEKAKASREGIETWTELAQALRRYEVWCRALIELLGRRDGPAIPPGHFDEARSIQAAVDEVRNEILEAADIKSVERLKVGKHLDRVYRRLAPLGAEHELWVVSSPRPEGSTDPWPVLQLQTATGLEDISADVRQIAAIQQRLPDSLDESASWLANADFLRVTPAQVVELGRTKRFIGDFMVLALSVATGVVASLSAFYFGKTFGTVEDFLTVIFVGTAAQAFLKPITDTLAQIRGSTEPVTKSDPEAATATTVAAAVSPPANAS
jgi:hypothetical protein